jgi:hypothetical protein
VPEHQPPAARRRLAVKALDDLAVGSADAEPQRLDEQLTRSGLRTVDLGQLRAAGLAGDDGLSRARPSHTHTVAIDPVPWRRMELGAPSSYLALGPGAEVYSSDGERLGEVEHVLAEQEEDIFDGIIFDASPLPGGHRFVDAPDVDEIYERGVVLKPGAEERLHRPEANPATMETTPDDVTQSDLELKLRRAWNWLSGNY